MLDEMFIMCHYLNSKERNTSGKTVGSAANVSRFRAWIACVQFVVRKHVHWDVSRCLP
jgi:hypothetical protein